MLAWLNRSGPVAMALIWAVGWGAGAGGFIEAFVDPHGEIEDVWPMVLGILGAIGGVAFWGLRRNAERRRSLEGSTAARALLWGTLAGLVVGLVARAVGAPPDAILLTGLLGALSGPATWLLFRYAAGAGARLASRPTR
jgi:hypothetical protein